MNYLREFLYRPKRSDTSLMARFFRADENLTAVAQGNLLKDTVNKTVPIYI